MKDIFDAKILCKHCDTEMKPTFVIKKGFQLRAVECQKCEEKIIHPVDEHKLQQYTMLKGKTYNVKLRVVGNSHAVSIPKEIVDFINETHRSMSSHVNDMVKLCLEDVGRLRLDFIDNPRNTKW